jgi:hypothetical protein
VLPISRISRNSRVVPIESQCIMDGAPSEALAFYIVLVASLEACGEFAIFNFKGLGGPAWWARHRGRLKSIYHPFELFRVDGSHEAFVSSCTRS